MFSWLKQIFHPTPPLPVLTDADLAKDDWDDVTPVMPYIPPVPPPPSDDEEDTDVFVFVTWDDPECPTPTAPPDSRPTLLSSPE